METRKVGDNTLNLSIIIPCKSGHDDPHIVGMVEATERICPNAQIIVSSDRYGRGKGWALREGLQHAQGDIICFIDGDLDIDPGWIPELMYCLQGCDIVIGKKPITGLWKRRVITFCSRLFIGTLFGLWCDTQTGIKMFRRNALPQWQDDSFAFDIEILSKAKKAKAVIRECPIEVNIRKNMPTRSILRFIKGALKIRLRLWAR